MSEPKAAAISLAQIAAALSVTYNDQGVAMWLAARNRGLGSAAPIDVIARDPGGMERVADLVRAIGDADPALFTMREDSDVQPCSSCEEPTGNPDTFCDACKLDELEQECDRLRAQVEGWKVHAAGLSRERGEPSSLLVDTYRDTFWLLRAENAQLRARIGAGLEWARQANPDPARNGDLFGELRSKLGEVSL